MVRVFKAMVPILALAAVAAGCSSSEGRDEQRLAAHRENYCAQLGAWQKARDAARTETPEAAEYDKAGAVAQDAFLAMRPLRDEPVGAGRTLSEATAAAMKNGDSDAEGRVVQYCADVGFETLTR
ncbi:hypothetical protein [Streptomyces sp. NPDC048560]|uniref:hypothetical protein n=1 Tax=Streptomyces sp. NPDC048560 TaxID=3155488 RepID=UPI00342E9BC5